MIATPTLVGSRLGKSGYVHHPRLPLDENVVAGQITAGPRCAVTGNRAVNQSLVHRPRLLRPEAEPLERAGSKVFHQHVGRLNQLGQERLAFDRFQIDGDALLVAVDAEKIRAPAADERRPLARIVAVPGILDLDHLGAHVAEQHRAQRPGQHTREVEDAQPGQRQVQNQQIRSCGE